MKNLCYIYSVYYRLIGHQSIFERKIMHQMKNIFRGLYPKHRSLRLLIHTWTTNPHPSIRLSVGYPVPLVCTWTHLRLRSWWRRRKLAHRSNHILKQSCVPKSSYYIQFWSNNGHTWLACLRDCYWMNSESEFESVIFGIEWSVQDRSNLPIVQ